MQPQPPVAARDRGGAGDVDDVDERDGRGGRDRVEGEMRRVRRQQRDVRARGRETSHRRDDDRGKRIEPSLADEPDDLGALEAVDDDVRVGAVGAALPPERDDRPVVVDGRLRPGAADDPQDPGHQWSAATGLASWTAATSAASLPTQRVAGVAQCARQRLESTGVGRTSPLESAP